MKTRSWFEFPAILTFALALLILVPVESFGQIRWSRPTLPNPDDFVGITAGMDHTCAVKYNGNVYCWGRNDKFQADPGNWMGTPVVRPAYVASASPTMQLDAGDEHNCVLNYSGIASCWGADGFGQVGRGNGLYGSANSGTGVSAVFGGRVFSSISAGTRSSCGASDSGTFCWGEIAGRNSTPLQMFPFNNYRGISVGYQHACMVFFGYGFRAADCFGTNQLNRFGQSGLDPSLFHFLPAQSSFPNTMVSRVSTQSDFTCADLTNDTVQCLGYNGWGQLGNGRFGGPLQGGEFQAQSVGNGMQLRGVSAGFNHACALDPSGRAFCWGNGHQGQLGNQAIGVFNTPQAVVTNVTFRAIAAGFLHTCGIGTDNQIYCWGNNNNGQLGVGFLGTKDPTFTTFWVPQLVRFE